MAPLTLAVRDETTTGKVLAALELQLEAETLTVADLIRTRVHQEVRARGEREIDARAETQTAFAAFERGQILLLVDERQVSELAESVTLGPGSEVVFLRLVPLVGG